MSSSKLPSGARITSDGIRYSNIDPDQDTSTAGSGGTYTLGNSNVVPTLAGSTGSVTFQDTAALTINTVGSTNGLTTTAGAISLTDTNSGGISLDPTNGALSAASGGIFFTSNALSLANTVTATGQTVVMQPVTFSAGVDIGGTTSGLQLSSASLNNVKAASLTIGNTSDTTNPVLVDTNAKLDSTSGDSLANVTNLTLIGGSGGITINSAVTMPSNGYLALNTTGTASQNSSGVLTTSGTGGLQLLGAAGTFNLNSATNAVSALAASLGSGTGTIALTNGGTSLSIGTVNGTVGVTAGTLTLTDTGTVSQTGTGVVTATKLQSL